MTTLVVRGNGPTRVPDKPTVTQIPEVVAALHGLPGASLLAVWVDGPETVIEVRHDAPAGLWLWGRYIRPGETARWEIRP